MTIPASAKIVLGSLGSKGRGAAKVLVSNHALALACGLTRGTVASGLKILVEAQLIASGGAPVEDVQPWLILHPRLLTGRETPTILQTTKRRGLVVECPRCHKLGVLRKTGWCVACTKDVDLDGRVRRKVAGALAERGIA